MQPKKDITRRTVLSAFAAAGLSQIAPGSVTVMKGRAGLVDRGDFVFPDGMTYMNTGSVGPSPRQVLEEMVATWHRIESSPVVESYSKGGERLESVRQKLAGLLNCDKEDLVLTGNTSDAMSRLSFALNLQPGDHVVSTDQEHEGGHDCWKFHARSRGVLVEDVAIKFDETDAQSIVDRFDKAITSKTKAVSFSHVLYTNGLRMPAAEICALARQRGVISIIDGAQAVGAVAVDIQQIGCDAYAAPGHKWLLGPKGTGFMYVSRAAAPRLELLSRLSTAQAQSDTTGLMNHMGYQGLGAAIDYVNRVGVAEIESHNLALQAYAFDKMQSLPVKTLSTRDGAFAAPLLAFKIDAKFEPRAMIAELLTKENLVVKALPKLGALRISTHLFNSREDVDRTVDVLARRLK